MTDFTIITGGADTASEGEAITATDTTPATTAAPAANLYTKATYLDLDLIDVNEASNVGRLTDADYGDVGALAASIVVSAQPVAPSAGIVLAIVGYLTGDLSYEEAMQALAVVAGGGGLIGVARAASGKGVRK